MKQIQTQAIVLSRTNYGEADRIITMLTPNYGKLRLMARGVRKNKSKLAGATELFSISDISYIKGRGEISTLISGRLVDHYGAIVKDIGRVQLGYDLIKRLNRATEDEPEIDYFALLSQTFAALDNAAISLDLIRLWFDANLIRLAGHTPNLQTDTSGQKLLADQTYKFDFDDMTFAPNGNFTANQIKLLRLLFHNDLANIAKVNDLDANLTKVAPLIRNIVQIQLRT